MTVKIEFDNSWHDSFLTRAEDDGPWAPWELFKLAYEIQEHTGIQDFDGLIAPAHLPQLTPLPHQLEAARTIIEKMNGKGILADEVGLGKTIEAGLILKEYMIRGLVKKVLILVPASLVSQWGSELNQKFYIPALEQRKSYVWEQYDVVVSSIDTAKREPHRSIVLEQDYDMVIIDEAHKLKNSKTKNYQFVQQLKKKYCLLLTATPIQNRVEEIFNLVTLLKPGHLGNEAHFSEKFAAKKRAFQHDEHLKALVNKVMVRNRRGDTGIDWPKRHIETVGITLSPPERELYETVTVLPDKYPGLAAGGFSRLVLQREVCSSKEAAYVTLKKMVESENAPACTEDAIKEISAKLGNVEHNSKAQKAVDIIKKLDDKVIIFTEYRATQLYLQWFLQQHGITSVPFRGGFKRSKKDWMRQLFRDRAQVMIATEAGGEGINLQFCRYVINYDLPWNPMRIEQRIGRIHRLGQTEDVRIFNFAARETIEEHILKLLYEKINLFERVIGELDEILTRYNLENIEDHIRDILENSSSEGEMRIKMDNLSAVFQAEGLDSGRSDQSAAT